MASATRSRFFCENKARVGKIFAERLPELTSVYARRTTCCKERLTELGFALGGKAVAALSPQLGLQSSRMTILSMPRQTPDTAVPTSTMLDVDEFTLREKIWHHPY